MGLIKTGLKAAVAVKTAHWVHDRIERRKQEQWAAQGYPPGMPSAGVPPVGMAPVGAPPAIPAAVDDTLARLTQLGELRSAGVLTDAEFEVQKARILGS